MTQQEIENRIDEINNEIADLESEKECKDEETREYIQDQIDDLETELEELENMLE